MDHRNFHSVVCFAIAVLLVGVVSECVDGAETKPLLEREAIIPLEGVGGRIDHMAIDLGRRRLIVAELGNDTVDVIDIDGRNIVHRISRLKEPQGVAYIEETDMIAVANAGDGAVRLFHAADFSPAGSVDLGDDADDLHLDRDGSLVAGYGNGGLAWIDTTAAAKLLALPLAAHPEGFQPHPRDGRVFVNVPDAHQIAVVDRATGKGLATWGMPWRSNFPLAITPTGDALATVFRSPAKLALIDPDKGAVVAQADTCGDADDVYFDSRRGHIYVSCGAGFIDVFEQSRSGLDRLGRVSTRAGARTSLFVPELDRLFVAARAYGRAGAAILVLRPIE